MITLRSNILFADSSPLFRFDSMTEATVYMFSLGYHARLGDQGVFCFYK